MKLTKYPFSLLTILIGILFSLYLQWQIPDRVYFSGDAGLKALLAQQLSAGIFHFDLILPVPEWVRQVWDNGLYAYEPPFVYQLNSKYFITFPFTFPLVTAPFQTLFDYRGLYFVPLVSTWLIWLIFYFVCQNFHFKDIITACALIALIFASPLTIYSAMYWEHSLAVALCFSGIAILLINRQKERFLWQKVVAAGSLIGFSAWFRPEFLCAIAILIALVYSFFLLSKIGDRSFSEKYNLKLYHSLLFTKNREILVFSAIATVGLFFFCNKLIYNHPLGIHAIQVVEKVSLSQKLIDAWNNFTGLSIAIYQYYCVTFLLVWFLVIFLIYKIFRYFNRQLTLSTKINLNLYEIAVYLICFTFIVGVSLLVPIGTAGSIAGGKQWGARFLLILIPIITLLAAQIFDRIFRDETNFTIIGEGRQEARCKRQENNIQLGKLAIAVIIVICLIAGINKNTFAATDYLKSNYQKILPAVQFLRADKHDLIVVSHQLAAQALEASFDRQKIFFKAETSQKIIQFSKALLQQERSEFIYICYPHSPCSLPEEKSENFEFKQGDRQFKVQLSSLGIFGKYPIYKGAIVER
jgi:hypothetical protein